MSFISPIEGVGIFMFILIILGISLLPTIFFLLTLHRTFDEISPENRLMSSGEVWLTLIPFFGMIWIFFIVQRMADSLQKEFEKRNIQSNELRPSYNAGITYAIFQACTVIPILGFLASLGTLICWIIYWIRVNDCKILLQRNPLVL